MFSRTTGYQMQPEAVFYCENQFEKSLVIIYVKELNVFKKGLSQLVKVLEREMASQQGGEYFASPLNVVFGSAGPQHEKALKHAFYNTAALVFVVLSGVIAVVVYYVLEAFIRPLLWAVLCGTFLHPFQRTATSAVRSWLKSLDETDTLFAVGLAIFPFKVVNESSELFGRLLKSNWKLIVTLAVLFPIIYYLIVFQPFLQIFVTFESIIKSIGTVLEVFQRPMWVWSIVAGYIVIVIFWWTPLSANVLSSLSVPVWTLVLIHLASYAGKWKVLIFLIFLILLIVGLVEEWKGKRQRVASIHAAVDTGTECADGNSNEEEPVLQNLLLKSFSIMGITSMSQGDSADNSPQPKAQGKESAITDLDQSDESNNGQETVERNDVFDGDSEKELGKEKGTVTETAKETIKASQKKDFPKETRTPSKPKLRPKKSCSKHSPRRRIGKSDPYFISLFWLFLLSRLWFHMWILQIVPIFIFIFLGKRLFMWLRIPDSLSTKFGSLKRSSEEWTYKRKDAIIPVPLRGIYKLMLIGDKKVIKWTNSRMEKLMSVLIILCLIVLTTIGAIFLAFQVQQESAYMASLVNNAVNETLTTHPELFRWLPENTDVKEAFDSMVHRAYVYGRKWMVVKLNSVLRGHHSNSTELEKQMTSFVDNLYQQWLSRNASQNQPKLVPPTSNTTAGNKNETLSLEDLRKLIPGNDTFELSTIFSIVKENVDTLKALFESVWSILKGNVNLAFSVITTVISIIFFSSTYVLNMGLSSIVFLTALFYLLSTSGSEYKVVEWMSGVSMGTRFSESVDIAVRDVFGATLKMATFYGFYTWMTHSIFGLNIVFIPSALAATLAAIPFIGTYYAAIPGALELWLVHDKEIFAILLIVLHFLPTYVVDIAIYSEITGGGHPYLTGLAVAGGMYWFGLEGAIIGPIVLCCLIAAFNIYNGIFQENKDEHQVGFNEIRQYDYTLQRTPFFRHVRRALSEER